MKVLMLTWEYPPDVVGGLARHVAGLSQALAKNHVDLNVITSGKEPYNSKENSNEVNEVSVYRVQSYSLPSLNFISDIHHLNYSIIEQAIKLINSWGKIDILHAHDWLVAYAARALKHIYQIPLISTLHATEYGRNNGLHNGLQHYISAVEWWLTYESWKVIVCSQHMKHEIKSIFQVPDDKIEVIPNGINTSDLELPKSNNLKREKYALPDEKIVFFIGRLVPEKGVQTLLQAVPKITSSVPKTKFLIAGKGPYEAHLKNEAVSLKIENNVTFLGYVDDTERNALYKYADVVVFPSLYEPFGIVALEGMAAGSPTVVADTGGFGEIIKHGINGLKFIPGDPDSLAQQILHLLTNPDFAKTISLQAKREVGEKYTWEKVAQKTLKVYREVIKESKQNPLWLPQWPKREDLLTKLIGRYEV